MNESEKLHLADWIAEATIAGLLAVSTAIAEWIRRIRKTKRDRMDARVKQLEDDWLEMKDLQAKQAEQIALTENNMANIKESLGELRKQTEAQTSLLHAILLKVRS